jgi:transposase
VLLYKRLNQGRFRWPRTQNEVRQLTPKQLGWLMDGLSIYQKVIPEVSGAIII